MIVDLMPTDDQAMIADSVSAFVTDKLPLDRLRDDTARGGKAEAGLWGDIAGLGIFGLGVSADRGGIGYGIPEEVIVAHAASIGLASPTVLATMLAAHGVGLEQYGAGQKRAAFVNLLHPGVEAKGPTEVHLIDAGPEDDLILCTPGGTSIFPASAAKDRHEIECIDEAILLERATIDLSAPSETFPDTAIFNRFELLVAAYLSGVAKGALDMAVEYAKIREQFGQPIGAFQAIKHACAEMARRADAAYSQTCYTAALAGTGEPDSKGAACARLLAMEAALENSRANIQIHGGMGFTEESNAHLYLKRAHVLAVLNSGKRALQQRIMADAMAA